MNNYLFNTRYQSLILLFLWMAGMLKAFFVAYIADWDIVLLALLLAMVDIMVQFASGIRKPTDFYLAGTVVILSFYAYLLFSLSYTTSGEYAMTKAMNFIPNLVFFAYALFIRKIDLKLLIRVYAVILIPLALFFVYMKSILWKVDSHATAVFMDLRNYYLAIGFHLGLLLFLCYYHMKRIWLMLILAFLLIASSARGALIFTILTFVLVEFHNVVNLKVRVKYLKIGLLTLGGAVLIGISYSQALYNLMETSISRLMLLFSEGGESAHERLDRMNFAITEPWSSLSTSLFGHGIGSFGIEYLGTDEKAYPHNLFLEVIFELGLLGLLLILFLFALVFYRGLKGNRLYMALFIFGFLNAMKSLSLTDLWLLFSLMGLVLSQTPLKQNETF